MRQTGYANSYWKKRAEHYNNLSWIRDNTFMEAMLAAGRFEKSDQVLDVGTGTGIMAQTIAPLVGHVTAIDGSPDMLKLAPDGCRNVSYVVCDARWLKWKNGAFDKVVARYVFHHILQGAHKAMCECYRVLKPGGRMVFAEGVPPSERTRQDFVNIFLLKEQRLTFMPDGMVKLMALAGFQDIETRTVVLPMSVHNWLESSDLAPSLQEKIYQMHVKAKGYFKEDYNLRVIDGDCFIDIKVVVLAGVKPW